MRDYIGISSAGQITKPERRSKLGSNASLTSAGGAKSRDMSPSIHFLYNTKILLSYQPAYFSSLSVVIIFSLKNVVKQTIDFLVIIGRARMGSPSGKSHDSDDSENGWIRRGSSSGKYYYFLSKIIHFSHKKMLGMKQNPFP